MNNMVRYKNQQRKNAGKQTYIIVCEKRKSKSYRVKTEFILSKKFYNAENNKRSDTNRIKPYCVPIISHKECTKREATAEQHKRNVVLLVNAAQKIAVNIPPSAILIETENIRNSLRNSDGTNTVKKLRGLAR